MDTNRGTMKTSYGVMFHHFYDDFHPAGQGAISASQFELMLDFLMEKKKILHPQEYLEKSGRNLLLPDEICLTFDDALLSQVDIALPILNRRKLSAFFFVYSSPFMGEPDLLELYRHFRMTNFININDFYAEFFLQTELLIEETYHRACKNFDKKYLIEFTFYSENDRFFRYLRDQILTNDEYTRIMAKIMDNHGFNISSAMSMLWMSNEDIQMMNRQGHKIGLHSYSHPTQIHKLSIDIQMQEYRKNLNHLIEVLGCSVDSMSHPCGNYSGETLEILKKMGIKIGFRSNLFRPDWATALELPRQDHSNLLSELEL